MFTINHVLAHFSYFIVCTMDFIAFYASKSLCTMDYFVGKYLLGISKAALKPLILAG